MGKLYSGRKGWLQVYHDWRLFAQGSWNIVCDWLWVHIWLSLVDPEFEMRVNFRKAVSHPSSPDHSQLMVAEVMV